MTPRQLLDHYDAGTPWPQASGLDVAQAYERAGAVRALRVARGEQPRGYKVGFTNRTIWPRYGVYAPIWGTVWDTTLGFCGEAGEVSLARTCQPRLEPECVFGLQATPPPQCDLDGLLACVEWIAPGFEIVQSHMPDWKFAAADTVTDGGLHALLHFVEALRACPGAVDLQPGDVVTTGTWTDAWPVAPGEQWRADFEPPLAPLAIRFT